MANNKIKGYPTVSHIEDVNLRNALNSLINIVKQLENEIIQLKKRK